MQVVITGGAGFLGRLLAGEVLARGTLTGPSGRPEAVDEVLLFDTEPPADERLLADPRVRCVAGDIGERDAVAALLGREDCAVFHLASVVSAGAERDFDGALRVNLDGGRHLLEACRALARAPRLVFASSVAVYGGELAAAGAGDETRHTPRSTYGTTKAILELLVNDYTRKGFIDGRSARLPTVIIRPGPPNAAASGFASALFREPLAGRRYTVPVAAGRRVVVAGYRSVVAGLVALHELPGEVLGPDRAVSFPGHSVTVAGMIAALARVAGEQAAAALAVAPDPAVEAIVASWPSQWRAARAAALGLPVEEGLEAIVRAYLEDFGEAC